MKNSNSLRPFDFLTFTLPCGIRCILGRTRSTVTYCALTINTGARDELPEEHGIAHFVEHTIFKGTERRKAFHINSRLENLGGELNAFTTKEDTTIHATVLKGDFPKAAELIADIVFRSMFPERELEREKQVVIDEINSYRDIPQEMLFDRFDELMFDGSPLGRNILGTSKTVKKFDSDKLKKFISRTYTPDQMVFAVVGNISEKTFVATCERYFGEGAPWMRAGIVLRQETGMRAGIMQQCQDGPQFGELQAGQGGPQEMGQDEARNWVRRSFERIAPPPLVPFDEVVVKGGNHQSHCILGNRAYSLSDARRLPLTLLVNILGGPAANSRLNTVLRERNGLSYNIEAIYSPFSDTGFAGIYFSCERDKLDLCRKLVDVELQRVISSPLSARQLSIAKKQFIGQFSISMDASEGYMIGAAKSFLIYNEIDSLKTVAEKVDAITSSEITDVAAEIFTNTSSLIYR